MALVTGLVRSSVARLLARREPARRNDLDDLSQHVLTHLFADDANALRRYDPSHGISFASYVCMISERTAISALRRRDHNPRSEHPYDPSLLDQCAHVGGSEQRVVERDHCRELLRRLEEELSPLGREVMHVLYGQGLSIEDASETLGITSQALYAWRSRIRKRAVQLAQEV